MREKTSAINHVAGLDPDDFVSKIVLGDHKKRFDRPPAVGLWKGEEDKTLEHIEMIGWANDLTDQLLEEYGLPPFEIPLANVRIFPFQSKYLPKNSGKAAIEHHLVFIEAVPAKMAFFKTLMHEFIHIKFYNAIRVSRSNISDQKVYRVGLSMASAASGYQERYFEGFNEAVTELLAMRLLARKQDLPLFDSERAFLEQVKQKFKGRFAPDGRPLCHDEVFTAGLTADESGKQFCYIGQYSYRPERELLDRFARKILDRSSGRYRDKEEVVELFVRGAVTGNILPLARSIEEAFGKGSFRAIAEQSRDIKNLAAYIETL